jgi:hypothetical protein
MPAETCLKLTDTSMFLASSSIQLRIISYILTHMAQNWRPMQYLGRHTDNRGERRNGVHLAQPQTTDGPVRAPDRKHRRDSEQEIGRPGCHACVASPPPPLPFYAPLLPKTPPPSLPVPTHHQSSSLSKSRDEKARLGPQGRASCQERRERRAWSRLSGSSPGRRWGSVRGAGCCRARPAW